MTGFLLAASPAVTASLVMFGILGLLLVGVLIAGVIVWRKVKRAQKSSRNRASVALARATADFEVATERYLDERSKGVSAGEDDVRTLLKAATGLRVTIDDGFDGLRASAVQTVCLAASRALREPSAASLGDVDKALRQYEEICALVRH
jgi:hypothetical protein